MKKNLIAAVTLLCAVGAFAQGQVQFNLKVVSGTLGTVWAPVFLPDVGDNYTKKSGNPAFVTINPGTTIYNGGVAGNPSGFVTGTGFTAQLWGGPAGTAEGALVVCTPTTTFRTQTTTSLGGTVNSVTAVVPGVNGLQPPPADNIARATLQLRVWENKGNTITTWADAIRPENNQTVLRGASALFSPAFDLGQGSVQPPTLQGLTSFNVTLVPEPSAIALGVLGVGALVLFRRRKN